MRCNNNNDNNKLYAALFIEMRAKKILQLTWGAVARIILLLMRALFLNGSMQLRTLPPIERANDLARELQNITHTHTHTHTTLSKYPYNCKMATDTWQH